jgi:non-specific serine/threonine protein kinase
MGGIGKSRLSVQLGAEVLDDYPDGVWLVELAPVADAAGVPQAVASVLGVREEPGGTVTDALLRFVRDRKLLLILDNCEHLVEACAVLAKAMLQAGPQLTLLASSRDALQIAGEYSYALEPLAVPAADAAADPERLREQDAVRLFIERAAVAQPAFRLTAANAPAVAAICAQLDGIPLALELAAARVRTLTVEAIAARLSDRFKLLVSQDRTVLPRQRTLRALIDWSYDLLGEAEKALFARLSVFAGGWTLEAAEAVGQGGDIASEDVLDLLARLVEKSLVRVDAESGRYGMLETVKAYAREKLEGSGELEGAVERHLKFFVEFATQARPQLRGPEQRTWMHRVYLEHDNLTVAHLACVGRPGRAGSDLSIVSSLKMYWVASGRIAVGLRMALEALANPGAAGMTYERAAGLRDAGMLCHFCGQYRKSLDLLEEGIKVARVIGELRVLPTALHVASIVSLALGESDRALRYCDEAAEVALAVGYRHAHAAALNTRGQVLRFIDQLQAAREPLETSLALLEELGDEQGATNALLNLIMIDVQQGKLETARNRIKVALDRCKKLNSPVLFQCLLDTCGALLAKDGQSELGLHLVAAADRLCEDTGTHRDPTDSKFIESALRAADRVAVRGNYPGGEEPLAIVERVFGA